MSGWFPATLLVPGRWRASVFYPSACSTWKQYTIQNHASLVCWQDFVHHASIIIPGHHHCPGKRHHRRWNWLSRGPQFWVCFQRSSYHFQMSERLTAAAYTSTEAYCLASSILAHRSFRFQYCIVVLGRFCHQRLNNWLHQAPFETAMSLFSSHLMRSNFLLAAVGHRQGWVLNYQTGSNFRTPSNFISRNDRPVVFNAKMRRLWLIHHLCEFALTDQFLI